MRRSYAHNFSDEQTTEKPMKQYSVNITGTSDLLLHNDNIVAMEQIGKWRDDPNNKQVTVRGDDRSPAWTWAAACYHNGDILTIPSDNLMTMLRDGAKRVSSGKRGTLKAQSQSSIIVDSESWPLLVNGNTVRWSEIDAMTTTNDFPRHEELARRLGFELFVKRATVGAAKHVRVRPRFRVWSTGGTITVTEPEIITTQRLVDILSQAGRFAGIGDWRPSSPKAPGPFGKFIATVEEI